MHFSFFCSLLHFFSFLRKSTEEKKIRKMTPTRFPLAFRYAYSYPAILFYLPSTTAVFLPSSCFSHSIIKTTTCNDPSLPGITYIINSFLVFFFLIQWNVRAHKCRKKKLSVFVSFWFSHWSFMSVGRRKMGTD